MISAVSARTAVTSARHSLGFSATVCARGTGDDLGGDRLELRALVLGIADGVHDEVAAAGAR